MCGKLSNKLLACGLMLSLLLSMVGHANTNQKVQQRIDLAVKLNKPVVIHVIVALADNWYQKIVPVPLALGNGRDPARNLYWGALYGVKTHLKRKGGWKIIPYTGTKSEHVLERIVFRRKLNRRGKWITVYLVADAWNGKYIKKAIQYYYASLAGRTKEVIKLGQNKNTKGVQFTAGGKSHLVAFIGHNGLMDFSINKKPAATPTNLPKGSIVLACKSKSYFKTTIKNYNAQPLVLTKGLMAPEAYTLDAAMKAWIAGEKPLQVRRAAAKAYQTYQKISRKASRWLFDAK